MNAVVHLLRQAVHFPVADQEAILEAAFSAGADVDYTCMQGTCGTCKTKVLVGIVENNPDDYEETALTSKEHAAGMRLLCVGFARSPTVELDR